MASSRLENKALCVKLLRAESEQEVTDLLSEHGLLDVKHWKVLGNMPNNRAMVNNQQQDPTGALVEKITNSIDAMLTRECFRVGISPESPQAPVTMTEAAERFFSIKEGNLANLTSPQLTALAENIQVVATGTKSEPCYLVIDQGEGQTPARFEETFLALISTNKAKIKFVQGKFNCGGTGVLPFCGNQSYELIISRRCPDLPSGPTLPGSKDATHSLWGFTLIRKLPASAGVYDTMTYVYLAPDGQIPSFQSEEIMALPEATREPLGEAPEDLEDMDEVPVANVRPVPRPYRKGLPSGTVIKLYNYRWKARSLATRDARSELEKYLYRPCLPIRIIEAREGYQAHYYATTLSGTAVTIAKDQEKGYLENNFPATGQLHPAGIGLLPISIVLYRERSNDETKKAKAPKSLARGLYFTINGQVHFAPGPEFFVTRGLSYGYIKDTLLVTVECTGLPDDLRDQLIMPSRDRLRKIAEFETIVQAIVDDLRDRDVLRTLNDQRGLRKMKEALTQEAFQGVLQSLINKDPVFASLFNVGRGLRNPYTPGKKPPEQPYTGKLPPTYFCFENNKDVIVKSFPIDRSCTVELRTDAVNAYFDLPNPLDRGILGIEPSCYERWHLWNGHLRIVFRAPSNARIGDSLDATITVTDPNRELRGELPWINKVKLIFAEGGKEVKSGSQTRTRREIAEAGLPNVTEIFKDRWSEFSFNERSALHIVKRNDNYDFYVNMDNSYLLNELLHRKGPGKETAKFAYKWGLALIVLGALQNLKGRENNIDKESETGEDVTNGATVEEQVCRFSMGVAAVIVPTVMDLLGEITANKEVVGASRN